MYIYNYMNIIEDEKYQKKKGRGLFIKLTNHHYTLSKPFLLLFLYPGYTYTLILKAWLDVRFLEIAYWFI